MLRIVIFFTFITFCQSLFPNAPPFEDKFAHELILKHEAYKLYWKYDEEKVTFEVHVKTLGWVGFGLSPNGGMPASDVVMGWVKSNGNVSFTDRHITTKSEPIIDKKQDWFLLNGRQENGFTILRFFRKQLTCDKEDIEINGETTRLIWSYNDVLPNPNPTYHGSNRGTKSVNLINIAKPTNEDKFLKDADYIDVVNNGFQLKNDKQTYYMCQIMKIGPYLQKEHIIMAEPIINKNNTEVVHHIVIYGCDNSSNIPDEHHGKSYNCLEKEKNMGLESCATIMFVWAIGGKKVFYPENVGFPIGGSDKAKFLLIETHFDNPDKIEGIIDRSGLRLWKTKKLRQYDMNIFDAGHAVTPYQKIPPKSKSFISVGHCPSECLDEALKRENFTEINVFAVLLHAHLKGVAIKVRHFRMDEEIEPLLVDDHYDFNFQDYKSLPVVKKIKIGDRLQVECTYDSSNTKTTTLGGLETNDEMCLAFLLYYPKIALTQCLSYPQPELIDAFYRKELLDQQNTDNMKEEWTEIQKNLYQTLVKSNKILAKCGTPTIKYSIDNKKTIINVPKSLYYPPPKCLNMPTPSENYTREIILKAPDLYKLFWKVDGEKVVFEIHVKTKGWVGFGISPNGGMIASDVVMGWVIDGKYYLSDRYAKAESEPVVDAVQNWELLIAKETEEYTILKFQREKNTCDKDDIEITDATTRLVWSYNDMDPTKNINPLYHGPKNRGTKSVQLINNDEIYINREELLKDVMHFDFLEERFEIPHEINSYYRCKIFKSPPLSKKHHVIAIEPIINHEYMSLVHHMILYSCHHNITDEHVGQSYACYNSKENSMAKFFDKCSTILFGWAIGSEGQYLPKDVAFPIGGKDDAVYYRLEIHYDNPGYHLGIIDSSGIRLWLTDKLRKNEAHVLEIGHLVTPLQIIPPKQKKFISVGYCPKECLNESMVADNVEEVKIFQVLLHSHLRGVAIKVRHFRDGIELKTLYEDQHYDFNFQEFKTLSQEIILKRGDYLSVECTYNTEGDKNSILGGLATNNEMCLAFFSYYPKITLNQCLTSSSYPEVSTIFDNRQTMYVNWSEEKYKEMQRIALSKKVTVRCRKTEEIAFDVDKKTISIEETKSVYVEKDNCNTVIKTTDNPNSVEKGFSVWNFFVLQVISIFFVKMAVYN